MSRLSIKILSVKAAKRTLVDRISMSVESGEIVALIGPNGAGKSMSLRGALGLVPATGSICIDSTLLPSLSHAQRARRIAYLPQSSALAWPARVRDIVALGRFAHGAAPARLSKQDATAVDMALIECQLDHLSGRRMDSLSGGEQARVHLARAFCAQTPLLIADEPVAALDPAQAFRLMDLLRDKARQGLGVLVVLHDIALAARYADRIIGMKDGRVLCDGPTEKVLTPEILSSLYGVHAEVDGRQVVLTGCD